MDTAQQLLPVPSEPLTWEQIRARYPDQFVCLVEIVKISRMTFGFDTARVVGHGPTHDDAFEPIRDLPYHYPHCTVLFTGVCTTSLIRPALVIDDETLEILNKTYEFRYAETRKPVRS